ncbi:hypothetical protein MRX96_024770 [Rhipicephalus microplus]
MREAEAIKIPNAAKTKRNIIGVLACGLNKRPQFGLEYGREREVVFGSFGDVVGTAGAFEVSVYVLRNGETRSSAGTLYERVAVSKRRPLLSSDVTALGSTAPTMPLCNETALDHFPQTLMYANT